ncbi:NADH-ubiquinone oxidoreductase chain E [invertebrate metagenome]|uniref:NADH-ubiquinone oxidoreductase chain E n=1 Tax=invertebrate metagenome TaxID=1711999 RepID=A0A484H4F3_9ZZZZ
MNEQFPASSNEFVFTAENLQRAEEVMKHYPPGRQAGATMPLLDLAQRQAGWLPRAAMDCVASLLKIPPIRVYEVATFYTMYRLQPIGQYHVQICTNISCWLRGSSDIVQACRDVLGVNLGETTPDNQFTLDEIECAGACVNAPVVQIGDDYFEDLDCDSMKRILETFKRGERPQAGSQIGRQCSCPAGGLTTLKSVPVKGGA